MTTGGEVKEWFTPLLNGFSATLKQGQFDNFRGNGDVKYIGSFTLHMNIPCETFTDVTMRSPNSEGDQRVSIQPIEAK